MSETTHKSKNSNTFRFKSFGERINEIDLRQLALYHIGHENERLTEDDETYFYQTLKKWTIINLTNEFSALSRKFTKIVNLAQLLHEKDFVIDALLEHLSTATVLSLQPTLELVYVLGRDLREDFYVYFQRILDRLICLLNTQDGDQLEWTLICLAHLFKTLKPYLKKNIGVVFNAILPLLDEQCYEEHVTNFAVECFAYVARDLRDYRKFLDFVLETVKREQVDSVRGCGRLIFELLRGVKGQLHSVADNLLQFLFECLMDEQRRDKVKAQLLFEIVRYAMQELLIFININSVGVFWQKLCEVAKGRQHCTKLEYLLPIFILGAEYKNGRYLAEMDVVVPTVLKLYDVCKQAKPEKSAEALDLLVSLVAKILLSDSNQLTQLDTSRLIKKFLTLEQRAIYHTFVLAVVNHAQFELLILPAVVSYFEKQLDLESFELLARIVLNKQPLALNACGLQQWKRYALQVKNQGTLHKIVSKLQQLSNSAAHLEEYLLLLILVPHLNALDVESLAASLVVAVEECIQKINATIELEKYLLLLAVLVETSIHIDVNFNKPQLEEILNCLLAHVCNPHVLGMLDLLLFKHSATIKTNKTLPAQLSKLLSQHNRSVRLTAAHCLHTLHKSTAAKSPNPYEIFYAAECIEPNVYNYREQLLLLQKLETAGEFFKSITDNNFKVDTLRYLLGLLYVNFKPIWLPVLKLIEDYAKVLPTQDFWLIYKEKLDSTAAAIHYEDVESTTLLTETNTLQWHSMALNDLLTPNVFTPLTQQELFNYRNLLWTRLPQFGQLTEIKNRDLVTLFLNFVNEEYRKHLEKFEFSWNLLATTETETTALEVDDIEVDEENDDAEQVRTTPKPKRRVKNKQNTKAKFILETLKSKLGIFINQPNPKALHREQELYSFYMDLLACPNAQLQKVALDCVMAYKVKALLNHKEQLHGVIDDNKFKEELINFKLDTVVAEQRQTLMPILLRLLYGKMITKGAQRNVSPQARKALILRFLGQCTTDEMFWFLQMAFGKYEKYTNAEVNLKEVPALVAADFQLSAVWSAKKLQNIVNLLELIRKEFGGLVQREFQMYMIKLLTFVGSVCNVVLQTDNSLLHVKMPIVYKNIKNNASQGLVNFFAHITEFEWQAEDMQCLTEVYVWPTIEKLPLDSIHTPTNLLKLLLQWGEQPKLFSYLKQQHPTSQQIIFHYIMELLLNEKTKAPVRKPILELVERLLVAHEAYKLNPTIAYNTLELIKPFIPQILKRLRMNLAAKRTGKQNLDKRELNILSLLTTHVEDAATCDDLLQLLLPILIARTQTVAGEEQVITQVITTLSNLIKRLTSPELYLLKIAPLFEQVQEVTGRKMLCQLVADIAKVRSKQTKESSAADQTHCERLKKIARIMHMLNAWDKRWVEQPDYEIRLEAFKEITQLVNAAAIDMDLGVLVIYNCFYFIKYDKDMGLRDNASEQLKLLVPKLLQKYAADKVQLKYLMNDVLLNLLRRLIRDHNDNARHEGIRLLGEMVRTSAFAHEILVDLEPLVNRQEAEADFFENITHLQVKMHGRALLKFATAADSFIKAPNPQTLTQFVLPLASRYLLQEKYAGMNSVVDAAIEAVGVACQLLPWPQYYNVLRYYLSKMRTSLEHQKQSVRIVVRILDAFHFELTKAETDQQALTQLKQELSEYGVAAPKISKTSAPIVKSTETAESQNVSNNKADEADEDNKDEADEDNKDEGDETTNFDADMDATSISDDETENAIPDMANVAQKSLLQQHLVLSVGAAKRVITTITTILIPTLNRSITEKSSYDMKHKVNRKRLSIEREEEEILRVPIALAMVKLLQKLPKELLEASLPGIFMKVCTFLRSPLKSVRRFTLDNLKKIMKSLGSSYLPLLMDHLQTLLTRGFQIHVLSVTVHGVLDELREILQVGDIDRCLGNVLEVAMNDIFGEAAVEKGIDKITAHTPEAKPSAKSYLILHIVARNLQETCLLDLLLPFRDHLARSQSRKVTMKIQDAFAKIVAGLVENPNITCQSLLYFIYGTISESITDLLPGTQKRLLTEQEKEKMRRARPDCYLIQPAPRNRVGAVNKSVKSNAQANAHILIEFGLEMLYIVLKRKKLMSVNYQPFLHPLLPLLRDALKSTHIRCTTFALKCFASIWNEEYELPALQEYIADIVNRMFDILKNFSTFGATKQEDNLQLVKSSFKAIVALLRKYTEYELTEEQITQLVLYVEQDLYEGENQAMCLPLLKALVTRKVDSKALHELMKKIGDLSIVSQSDFVRNETRAILFIYLMEYKLKHRVDQIIKFMSAQLCYSLPTGRQSVIKFLHTVIQKFPHKILAKRAEFLFLTLGLRLVNDDEPDCRRAVAECIELLINRLDKVNRQRLFDIILLLLDSNDNPTTREMAACLCSRFLNVEKQSFAPRLKTILSSIQARITLNNPNAPGRFVRAPGILGVDVNAEDVLESYKNKGRRRELYEQMDDLLGNEEAIAETVEEKQRAIDHEIIQMQYCLLKILDYCGQSCFSSEELVNIVDELAYESQRLLAHEHTLVRCNAAKILTHVLGNYDFDLIAKIINKEKLLESLSPQSAKLNFIYINPEMDIKSLTLDLCAQITPGETAQEMLDEIVKIFLYIGNMLRNVSLVDDGIKINLLWFASRIRFLINKEVARAPHSTQIRTALFTLIEGFITLLNVETIELLLPTLLPTLVREMSDDDETVDLKLRQLALHVGSRLRKRIGSDLYDKLRTNVQTKLMMRRAERKKVIAQEKIHDPVRAAKRKVGVQERKKVAKKRKTELMRGKVEDVKQKLKKRKRKAEDDLF